MKSKIILAIHTSVFFAFAGASISSPFVAVLYPKIFFSPYVLAAIIAVPLVVVRSWGSAMICPFTVWENNLRKREGRETYPEPCIDHYAHKWFGLTLPQKFSTNALLFLLALPIAAALFAGLPAISDGLLSFL